MLQNWANPPVKEELPIIDSDVDLSSYNETLQKQRNNRSLSLRQGSIKSIGIKSSGSNKSSLLVAPETQNTCGISEEELISVLNGADSFQISNALTQIVSSVQKNPKSAPQITNSTEISEPLVSSLQAGHTESVVIQIIDAISILYPLCTNLQEKLIDDGLTISLLDFIESESAPLLYATIQLITVLAETCQYSRDSLLGFGIHSYLFEIAMKGGKRGEGLDNMIAIDPFTDAATHALNRLFSFQADIELDIISSCLDPFMPLLELQSVSSVKNVIESLTEITNKMPALINLLFDKGIYVQIAELMQIQELIQPSLRLIGNLSIGQPAHIEIMLQQGLFDILLQLMDSEFVSDALWICSNIMESVSSVFLPLISEDFMKDVMNLAVEGNYETQKEAVFFLATYILFTPLTTLQAFITEDVTEDLTKMLACGVEAIMMRSLDSIMRIYRYEATQLGTEIFKSLLVDFDIVDRLHELTEQNSVDVATHAANLMSELHL